MCRPPPGPPFLQSVDEERIEVLARENLPYVNPEYMPPPKPPRMYGNA